MASANTLCKKLLNVKNVVVESHDFYTDIAGAQHLRIQARPDKWHQCRCPYCGKKCPKDGVSVKGRRQWRSLDFGSILVEIESDTQRINCPEHGRIVADVPWAYPGSRFTKDFDLTVGWLAVYLPRSVVSEYMRIDWKTVGRCVSRTLHEIEPERNVRRNGLVHIGIDETSYKKGHKYITIVLNHDTNTVVWAAPGHGKKVLEQFYWSLTPEQLASIKVVTGDGARWITDCVNEFTPDCERCVDPFHVVEWAMDALDEVRREVWREAYSKAPENLTEDQQLKLEIIQQEDPRLYRAYLIKERLRLILKIRSVEEAAAELKRWLWWASHSRIPAMHDLYAKVKRHKEHILNTIRLGLSNARIETANNKIKLIIRKAFGFRNMDNLLDMVYLVCSDLTIPLPNRSSLPRNPHE